MNYEVKDGRKEMKRKMMIKKDFTKKNEKRRLPTNKFGTSFLKWVIIGRGHGFSSYVN